jgi:hypothetical protein
VVVAVSRNPSGLAATPADPFLWSPHLEAVAVFRR